MADIVEPTDDDIAAWEEFVAGRPPNVRNIAEHFKPWKLYRIKETGQRCTLYSFGEHDDGSVTLSVDITSAFNVVLMDRRVFGIDPNDLEECDLPADDENHGSILDESEQVDFINAVRATNGLPPIIE